MDHAETVRTAPATGVATPARHVEAFHRVFDLPILDSPTVSTTQRRHLRWSLVAEEAKELKDALGVNTDDPTGAYDTEPDLVEIADALADLVYVAYGAALEFGIDLDAVLAEVHRSNMTKLDKDGRVLRRNDGKVLKSELFEQPRIREVLRAQPRSEVLR